VCTIHRHFCPCDTLQNTQVVIGDDPDGELAAESELRAGEAADAAAAEEDAEPELPLEELLVRLIGPPADEAAADEAVAEAYVQLEEKVIRMLTRYHQVRAGLAPTAPVGRSVTSLYAGEHIA
jgi:hypothetical protein